MSTESFVVSRAEQIRQEELRKRQAEAREARRRADAEKARIQAEEAARKRIKAAQDRIAEQEARYVKAEHELDEASQRLPDLTLKAPGLTALETSQHTPEIYEAYADQLEAEVDKFVMLLEKNITIADEALERRLALGEAWDSIRAHEARLDEIQRVVAHYEQQLEITSNITTLPDSPDEDAELDTLQKHQEKVEALTEELTSYCDSLMARENARRRSSELAGVTVTSRPAESTLKFHQEQQQFALLQNRKQAVNEILLAHELTFEELKHETRQLINSALESSDLNDAAIHSQLQYWIAREKQHRDGKARARSMLKCVPEYVQEDKALSERWALFTTVLQKVINGTEEFVDAFEKEYQQITIDANYSMQREYSRANFVCGMSEQGMIVLESAEDENLVVLDLQDPNIWHQTKEYISDDGTFGLHMELMTDNANTTTGEEAEQVIDSTCKRLAAVKLSSGQNVDGKVETVSRTRTLSQAARPTLRTYRIDE